MPNTMDGGTSVIVSISGAGFVEGGNVTFENGQGPTPTASGITVVDASTITATVSVGGGGPKSCRVWDVRVTIPDGSTGVLDDGFRVDKGNKCPALHVAPGEPYLDQVGETLTQELLDAVVPQAVAHWARSGVDSRQLDAVREIEVQVDNLSGSLLGLAHSNDIVIDRDAAGYGWSVGGTGGVDLLSAVTHELGHLLGFDHDVMGSTLGVGVRDLDFLDDLGSESESGTQIRQPGDANRDGRFDQRDLVAARQGAKYLTGQTADWTEGDWNGDGLFDQLDIVAALQKGNYLWATQNVTEVDAVFAQLSS